MKIGLEHAIVVGSTWVAAVVGQTMGQHATSHQLAFTADRRPLAILMGCGEQLTAFTPTGEPLALAEVERWCPGATAQFTRSRTGNPARAPDGPQTG